VGQTRIVLVRHGESKAQEGRFVGGHSGCTGLSDLGVRQVTALRDRLAGSGELAGATALYASILPRAVQTAEIIAPALGDLEIRSEDEFERRWPWPGEWTPEMRRDPGSESFADMRARVSARLDALIQAHPDETVVVACHGGVVLHSVFRWLELEPMGSRTRAWLDPVNSSVTEWRIGEHRDWRSRVELVRFNDHGHLRPDLMRRPR
jgi:probable phosphoglycerate mutase